MFRKVDIDTAGSLYFHSMPGRCEPFDECCAIMQQAGVGQVICLNPLSEIERKSPDYARAIADKTFPFKLAQFPITNCGVPDDREAFFNLAQATANQLEAGENVLVHCAGGVGRTGTFAACVLKALGRCPSLISTGGGKAETDQQKALIAAL